MTIFVAVLNNKYKHLSHVEERSSRQQEKRFTVTIKSC